jgi:hypothetical protein
MTVIIHLLAYEDGTECSETSAYKIQTSENYPEENIQHTEHGESLKSRIVYFYFIIGLCYYWVVLKAYVFRNNNRMPIMT